MSESPSPAQAAPLTRVTYVDGVPARLALQTVRVEIVGADGEVVGARELEADRVRIGAAPENDLTLDDPTVSRHHCELRLDGGRWMVRDLDSTNGTFVDLVQVREAFLRPGCTLWLGKTRLRVTPVEQDIAIAPSERARFGDVVGAHASMRTLYAILERVAPTDSTVVLEGETGTGKDVVARAIHAASHRRAAPFVVFDCGAVPRNLVESELFGHERGAFTGAIQMRKGVFELAHGGTVFLDELGELPLDLQPRLLRVLEQREVKRVGAARPAPVDVRVVAATNRRLEAEVRAGRFREDLYYRLGVVRLELPALRARREDVPLLVEHFLESARFNRGPDGRRVVETVTRPAMERLLAHDWPGNVRELVNAVERAVRFADAGAIDAHHLPPHVGRAAPPPAGTDGGPAAFKDAKERWLTAFEHGYLAELLARHDGNLTHAAREAELDRKHLRHLLQKHDLHPRRDGD